MALGPPTSGTASLIGCVKRPDRAVEKRLRHLLEKIAAGGHLPKALGCCRTAGKPTRERHTGVTDDRCPRIAGAVVARVDESLNDLASLCGGYRGDVVGGPQRASRRPARRRLNDKPSGVRERSTSGVRCVDAAYGRDDLFRRGCDDLVEQA